jgi:hypothetical protein
MQRVPIESPKVVHPPRDDHHKNPAPELGFSSIPKARDTSKFFGNSAQSSLTNTPEGMLKALESPPKKSPVVITDDSEKKRSSPNNALIEKHLKKLLEIKTFTDKSGLNSDEPFNSVSSRKE